MNISSLLSSYNNKTGVLRQDDFNTKVAIALAHVVQNFILANSSYFVLTLGCTDICSFFNNILEKVFYMWGVALLQIVTVKTPVQRVPGPRNYNVILVDSFEVFATMDFASYTAHNNYNEYYFIFLQIIDALAPSEMQKIFNYCWSNYLINCDVLLQNASGEIMVYTYYPFTSKKCGSLEAVLINRFNGSGFEYPEMFPQKLLNFHGCPLRAALWNIPPYLSLKTNDKGISEISGGFEGNLLLELSKKLNFTIDVIIPPNNEKRGRFVNNEWNGALGMLHKRLADLSLGCFRKTPARDSNASSINNHYLATQIITVPKAAYIFTPSEVLFFPFTTETWIFIIFIFGFSFILLTLFKKVKHYQFVDSSNSLLNLLLVFLGMPFSGSDASLHFRIFWTTWLIFTLIIRAMYQSLLFHIIRTRTTRRIPEDVTELVAENYTIVVNNGTANTLDYSPVSELKLHILGDILEMMVFEIILSKPSRKIAAIAPLDLLFYYIRSEKKDDVFEIIKQKVVNLPFTIYFTKHSYLINEIHDQVMWIKSSGFLDVWVSRELRIYKKGAEIVGGDESQGFKELYVSMIIGTCGLALATFVFVLEKLSERFAFLKQIFSRF